MSILKEGAILKNQLFFEQTAKPYYCSLCYGSWNPNSIISENIFDSEATETRFSPTIETGWNNSNNNDYINISFQVNYPEDIIFNRIILIYGGLQRGRFDVNFTGFNSLTIVSPEQNDFIVGDRILINSKYYEVSDSDGFDLGLTPALNSPNLPSSGSGIIKDASGVPIVGSVMDDIYQITNNTTINFLVNGSSI